VVEKKNIGVHTRAHNQARESVRPHGIPGPGSMHRDSKGGAWMDGAVGCCHSATRPTTKALEKPYADEPLCLFCM
jgi:hypothetical protein